MTEHELSAFLQKEKRKENPNTDCEDCDRQFNLGLVVADKKWKEQIKKTNKEIIVHIKQTRTNSDGTVNATDHYWNEAMRICNDILRGLLK